jgi:ubiquinone/menaquinone biosynthesis C-methylase UbiE
MSDPTNNLKERVRAFWQAHPCGSKFANGDIGTKEFFELIEAHRYRSEWHIPQAADFASAKGKRVLEIGCGVGTDGAQFAKAGAIYTGVDLTSAAVRLAQRNFELQQQSGTFQTADAERLDFADESFDIVYSHGVLHHTPNTQKAITEVHRVLRTGGRAIVMLYHRNSYNYVINIRLLRRIGAQLLRWNLGVWTIHRLTGEPVKALEQHAALVSSIQTNYFDEQEFLNNNTDGVGNPLSRVYSRREALKLFEQFSSVRVQPHFLNKRFIPVLGDRLPRSIEAQLAGHWGWHLWIYAEK